MGAFVIVVRVPPECHHFVPLMSPLCCSFVSIMSTLCHPCVTILFAALSPLRHHFVTIVCPAVHRSTGPAAGEGCSLEGGCASCPYMKMNSLAALQSVCEKVGSAAGEAMLLPFRPRLYQVLLVLLVLLVPGTACCCHACL